MINYWLAGVHFTEGNKDDSELFFRNGVWEMHFSPHDNTSDRDHYFSLYTNIRAQDRIALKIAHHHSKQLHIKGIGIVQENPHSTITEGHLMLYVAWVLHAMNRHLPADGHYQRLHGPINSGAWRDKIFSI